MIILVPSSSELNTCTEIRLVHFLSLFLVSTRVITDTILGRHLRRDLQYYLKHVPCKIALVLDNLTVEVEKPCASIEKEHVDHAVVFSMSKPVPLSSLQDNEDIQQSVISTSYSASINSYESLDRPKGNTVSSLSNRSLDLPSDDYRSTPKQDKSGQIIVLSNYE